MTGCSILFVNNYLNYGRIHQQEFWYVYFEKVDLWGRPPSAVWSFILTLFGISGVKKLVVYLTQCFKKLIYGGDPCRPHSTAWSLWHLMAKYL